MIDITLKSGTTNPGAEASMTAGSRDYLQPAFQYGGRSGAIDYFVAGQFLHNGIGIENPTSSYSPLHDDTDQWYALGKVTGIVDRGPGKGAMIYSERVVVDAVTGEKLATIEQTTFARGDGNDEQRHELSGHGLQVMRKGDEVDVRRIQHDLHRHQHDDEVPPDQYAEQPGNEQHGADRHVRA